MESELRLPRVIPCLLLKQSGLVKTVRFQQPRYVGDPRIAVRIFNEKEVDELMLLDISATAEGRGPRFPLVAEIASECFMPLAYGGGIRTLEEIEQLFSLGLEKVVLNTAAAENPALVAQAAARFGSQSIVVSIDARKTFFGHKVYTRQGTRPLGKDPVQFAKEMQDAGAGELVVQSIDRDGTMTGYDLPLVRSVCQAVQIPVIACGGAGQLQHLQQGMAQGAAGVAAGSLFVFYGKHRAVLINYPTFDVRKLNCAA